MNPSRLFSTVAYLATLLFIFSIPWENAITISGIGTISRALGMPLLAAWVLMLMTSTKFRTPSPFLIMLFCFVFWCSLTLMWNDNTDIGFRQVKTFAQLYLSVLIIWTCMFDERKCHSALAAFTLGAWIVVIVVFYNYYAGNVTRWDKRASIAGVDENDIALTLATCLPIAWYMATRTNQTIPAKILSVIFFLYIPSAFVAIVMTGSRGGVASTLPFLIYLAFSFRTMSTTNRLTSIIFLVGASIIAVSFFPETPLERIIETADQLDSRNISGRYDIWTEGISIWLAKGSNAFFGLGVGGYVWKIGRVAHSTYVSILVEAGLIGMILFLIAMATLVHAAVKAPARMRHVALAVLATWAIGAAALSWEYRKPTWVIWGLLSSLVYLRSTESIEEYELITTETPKKLSSP